MINHESLEALNRSHWHRDFQTPLYSGYCLHSLPGTIESLFGVSHSASDASPVLPVQAFNFVKDGSIDNVVVMLIDGFGWRFWQHFLEIKYPAACSLEQCGVLSNISSGFPSTTTAQLTNLFTGLAPGESGVYEWSIYEPLLNSIICPLLFSFAEQGARESLKNFGLTPHDVFPEKTIFQKLSQYGVNGFLVQPQFCSDSSATQALGRGARIIPHSGLSDGLAKTYALLGDRRFDRKYCFLYDTSFDSACHRYGPSSREAVGQGAFILDQLASFVSSMYCSNPNGNTVLMIIADHGHTEIDPATTVYINESLPCIVDMLDVGRQGQLLAPEGSPRDLFLRVSSKYLEESVSLLSSHLNGIAEVHKVSDLISMGFFGPQISPAFLSRVANVVVLPRLGNSVWWKKPGSAGIRELGYHGGLTKNEMATALLTMRL